MCVNYTPRAPNRKMFAHYNLNLTIVSPAVFRMSDTLQLTQSWCTAFLLPLRLSRSSLYLDRFESKWGKLDVDRFHELHLSINDGLVVAPQPLMRSEVPTLGSQTRYWCIRVISFLVSVQIIQETPLRPALV